MCSAAQLTFADSVCCSSAAVFRHVAKPLVHSTSSLFLLLRVCCACATRVCCACFVLLCCACLALDVLPVAAPTVDAVPRFWETAASALCPNHARNVCHTCSLGVLLTGPLCPCHVYHMRISFVVQPSILVLSHPAACATATAAPLPSNRGLTASDSTPACVHRTTVPFRPTAGRPWRLKIV